jgi:hypothetical protein
MKSQKSRISNYLAKTGKAITPMEALNRFGCFRLSERIREIEAEGDHIARAWVTVKKARFMSYRMV